MTAGRAHDTINNNHTTTQAMPQTPKNTGNTAIPGHHWHLDDNGLYNLHINHT